MSESAQPVQVPRKRSTRATAPSRALLAAQNRALRHLSQLITHLTTITDPAPFLDAMTTGIRQALDVATVVVWLHNPASRRYMLSHIASSEMAPSSEDCEALQTFQVRSGEGLAGLVVSAGSAHTLVGEADYRATFGPLGRRREVMFSRLRTLLPDEFQVLALPLISENKVLGVVEIFSADNRYNAADLEWLQWSINQCATLLRIARIQADAVRQRQRLAALDAVVTAIGTASDLPDLLNVTLLVMMEVVGATGGAICLVSPGEHGVYLAAHQNLPDSEAELLNTPEASLVLEDVVYYGQPTLRPLGTEHSSDAVLLGRAAIPLLAGGTVVGVLLLYQHLDLLSGELDLPALVSVGSQVGIAIANTRLYEESQRERQRLSTVIASIADGVAICDRNGDIILANEAAASMLGLASMPLANREYQPLTLEGGVVEATDMPLARALAGEVFRDYQLVLPGSGDDHAVLSFSGAPLRGSSLQTQSADSVYDGAVVVFRDITEQRRLDEAKDEFLAVAAHELRSPLAAIKGYSDLLLRREQRNGSEERTLRGHTVLNQQVNVLVQLVDNLLDMSRLDAGRLVLQPEEINLGELVATLVNQMRSTSSHHTIVVEPELAPVHVLADQLRLRQVVTNLVTNAVRYSSPGTTVRVRVSADLHYGRLIVDDEGPGVPLHERERLFERYYRVPGIRRTGSSTEGLGIGLYLCREIVAMHGGRIWVESAPSGGARFQVLLPVAAGDDEDIVQQHLALDEGLLGIVAPESEAVLP